MKRSQLREDMYQGLLDSADSSCHYWWFDHRADSTNAPIPDLRDVTTDDVARGWWMLHAIESAGRFHCCGDDRRVRDAERDVAAGEDEGTDIYCDCVSDAVIQLALLGKMIYG